MINFAVALAVLELPGWTPAEIDQFAVFGRAEPDKKRSAVRGHSFDVIASTARMRSRGLRADPNPACPP